MVIPKSTVERIRRILKNNYAKLGIFVLGFQNLTEEDQMRIRAQGGDAGDSQSLLETIYNYNYLNNMNDPRKPKTLEEAEAQANNPAMQPVGEAHQASYEHLNSNMQHLLEKHRNEVMSKVEGIIRDNNNDYKFDALQNLARPDALDTRVKAATVNDIKRELSAITGEVNRNWTRIAVTETSNAIGLGAADRIVKNNRDSDMDDVYVYRVNPNDAATCSACRNFYIDSDGSPKVYRMSTLLGNGSNYGKKKIDWRPVIQSTHVNCRDSQPIQLMPGWKVLPDGRQTFIGLEAWKQYILDKVQE